MAIEGIRLTRRRLLAVGAAAFASLLEPRVSQVWTGPSPDRLEAAAASPRNGFETAITMSATSGFLSVVALDASGDRLGMATPIPV
jgi:hypothetical protein